VPAIVQVAVSFCYVLPPGAEDDPSFDPFCAPEEANLAPHDWAADDAWMSADPRDADWAMATAERPCQARIGVFIALTGNCECPHCVKGAPIFG
jgi:hypothetical protein